MLWWGSKDVRCHAAEVELRVGGRYHIGNLMPGASVIWSCREFLEVVKLASGSRRAAAPRLSADIYELPDVPIERVGQ